MSSIKRRTIGTPLSQYTKVPLAQFQTPRLPTTKLNRSKKNIVCTRKPPPLKEKIKELEESILRPNTCPGRSRRTLVRMRSRSASHLPSLVDTHGFEASPVDTCNRVATTEPSQQSKFERKRNLPLRRSRSRSLDHFPDMPSLHVEDERPVNVGSLLEPAISTGKGPPSDIAHSESACGCTLLLPSSVGTSLTVSSSHLPSYGQDAQEDTRPRPTSVDETNTSEPAELLMPCLKPDEVLLIRAEVRLTKHAKVRDNIRKHEEDMQNKLDAWEQKKQDRMVQARQRKKDHDRHLFFLPLVMMLRAGTFFLQQRTLERTNAGGHPIYRRAAGRILNCLPVLVKIRILRKKRAANILRHVIREIVMLPQMTRNAHRLLCRICTVQRQARSFIARRKAAVEVLSRRWLKEEFEYVEERLREYTEASTHNVGEFFGMSLRDGLCSQSAVNWNRTEIKMKNLLTKVHRGQGLKSDGMLVDSYVRSFFCSADVREAALLELIKEMRREFMRHTQELKNELFFRTDYAVDDARMFLQGSLTPHANRSILMKLYKFNPVNSVGSE